MRSEASFASADVMSSRLQSSATSASFLSTSSVVDDVVFSEHCHGSAAAAAAADPSPATSASAATALALPSNSEVMCSASRAPARVRESIPLRLARRPPSAAAAPAAAPAPGSAPPASLIKARDCLNVTFGKPLGELTVRKGRGGRREGGRRGVRWGGDGRRCARTRARKGIPYSKSEERRDKRV